MHSNGGIQWEYTVFNGDVVVKKKQSVKRRVATVYCRGPQPIHKFSHFLTFPLNAIELEKKSG